MPQKLKIFALTLALLVVVSVSFLGMRAQAATCSVPDKNNCTCTSQGCDNGLPAKDPKTCPSGKVDKTDASNCAPLGSGCIGQTDNECLHNSQIIKDLQIIVDVLSAGVGIIITAVIIIGGIQYSMAGGESGAVANAKKRIANGIFALIVFMFMWAFLQWLIPGGVFSK